MIEFYWSGQRVAHSPQKAPGPEGGQWGTASQHLTILCDTWWEEGEAAERTPIWETEVPFQIYDLTI